MKITEQPARAWLSHLRRHPLPELMDGECLAALKSVALQYGATITHGAGLEVRLGEEARYVDYIMSIDVDSIPHVKALWYEIDYREFKQAAETGRAIEPCLFMNTKEFSEAKSEEAYWDAVLPAFLGEDRAKKLRAPLDAVRANLPEHAGIKQIGTMTSRGEIDIMRLVIRFPVWESIAPGLAAIGWPGDTEAFRAAMEPWKENRDIAVNIDLGEQGLFPKIGIEVFSRWRHPLLVDKFIARLELAGLCLPSKAKALRRWIRIRPDGDPFIQTLIAYFKLNYKDGEIVEAKAYLEQSPYVHHHYFDAYERPVRLDLELAGHGAVMRVGDALERIWNCVEAPMDGTRLPGVRLVRVFGGEHYEHLDRVLKECRENGLRTEVVLSKPVGPARLGEMVEAGADAFLVDGTEGNTLKVVCSLHFPHVLARWRLHRDNAERLEAAIREAEALGVEEFIVTGLRPCAGENREAPTRAQIGAAAEVLRKLRPPEEEAEQSATKTAAETATETAGQKKRMKISVESCFSQLAAYLGGEDSTKNPNRGVAKGCEAGRSFFAVRADGKFSPCLFLGTEQQPLSFHEYWESSPSLAELRDEAQSEICGDCCYQLRCRPCPASNGRETCPLRREAGERRNASGTIKKGNLE